MPYWPIDAPSRGQGSSSTGERSERRRKTGERSERWASEANDGRAQRAVAVEGSVGFIDVWPARVFLSSTCLRFYQRIGFGFGEPCGWAAPARGRRDGCRRRRPFPLREESGW